MVRVSSASHLRGLGRVISISKTSDNGILTLLLIFFTFNEPNMPSLTNKP